MAAPGRLTDGHPVWRIRDRAAFADLRARGRRGRSGPVTVTWLADDRSAPPRVAYAIGRQVGNAVARNRLRRRLRHVVTALAPTLAPGAYLIGAGPGATRLSSEELRASVSTALTALKEGTAP